MAARKRWEDLSPKYRARLLSKGITKSKHESGASLHKARGKVSRKHESQQNSINRFINQYEKHFGFEHLGGTQYRDVSASEYRQLINSMSPRQQQRYMDRVNAMRRAYEHGDRAKASALYRHRDTTTPDFMYYYHGGFN